MSCTKAKVGFTWPIIATLKMATVGDDMSARGMGMGNEQAAISAKRVSKLGRILNQECYKWMCHQVVDKSDRFFLFMVCTCFKLT